MVTTVDSLVERVKAYHPGADGALIERAYSYAQWAHRNQRRRSGEPYFVHPAGVAGIIAELRLDTASICAGLLHDVVEDTDTTLSDIASHFGTEIARLVDGLTKLNNIDFSSREDRQAESFRKMVVAMAKDLRVLLVKLCDRLDNMRSLDHMKEESQERIATETMEIYAPLANRLGMQNLKSELEDLALKYLEPKIYTNIIDKLKRTEKERTRYIDGVSRTVVALLSQMGFASTVTGRAKHITSIHRRMKEHQCSFEQIYDLLGFRICVESAADCYATLGVIHSKWTPVPGRFKDYIALPKPNRYQSLHTTVVGPGQQRIEIQIRTHEMHRVAEWGVVAHWDYTTPQASGGGVHPEDAAKYSWLRELAQFQKDLKDPAEFLESVKIDLFPDEVYVFTPRGDVRMFPRGATLIDFAYAIHTEVGDHCSGARVNGQLAPIRDKLRNGDVVEVTTSSDAQPLKDWLEACVTTRARNRIRGFLRAERREKSMNLGRELLGTEMHTGGMSLTKFLKNAEELGRICRELQVSNREELFVGIGFGKIEAEDVVRVIRSQPADAAANGNGERQTPVPEFKEGAIERFVRKVQRKDHGGIRVSGSDEVLIRYAKCCNPVTGDAIIGFITRGRGVTVHRRECPKAFDSDPERRVEVSWSSQAKITRPVSLRVRTENEPGILANVTQTFSAQHINISEANCRASKDGLACNIFTFMADDLTQLKTLMRELDKVRGVVQVERV
jgi:GTP diphosphokinase / guanosine-3',5'-bis(diphosphate) 3'-diphosphatase